MVQDSVVASKALGEVQTIVSAAVIDANPLLFGRAFPQAEAMLLSILGELREHIDKETIQVQVGAEQRWLGPSKAFWSRAKLFRAKQSWSEPSKLVVAAQSWSEPSKAVQSRASWSEPSKLVVAEQSWSQPSKAGRR